jgi:hypothetical protein
MMSSVRNCVSLSNARFFGATLVTGAILFVTACHSGVETPVSPSNEDISVPTVSSTALAGGPIEFTMNENNGSGYSGTCTIGTGGPGFRLKAAGRGEPGSTIRFQLRDPVTTFGPAPIVEVDERGEFRVGWDRITYMSSGETRQCIIMGGPGDSSILAESQTFQIP